MKTNKSVLLAAALLASAGYQSQAVTIVAAHGPDPFGVSFQEHQYLAQNFAITGSLAIDSVTLNFLGGSSFTATLSLSDNLGPSATAANLLHSETFTVPASGLVTIPFPASIGSGGYFLVLSTTEPFPANANMSDLGTGSETETFGLVGLGYFSLSQNASIPIASAFGEHFPVAFEINGTFTGMHNPVLAASFLAPSNSVPDSGSSLAFLALGAIAVYSLRRGPSAV